MAQSGHSTTELQCPLLGVYRTWHFFDRMSANDHLRKSGARFCCDAQRNYRLSCTRSIYLSHAALATFARDTLLGSERMAAKAVSHHDDCARPILFPVAGCK